MLTLEAVRLLDNINLTIANILTQIKELATQLPEYSTVLSMKGVGDRLSVLLIAEIGDVRRFHSGSALVAYAAWMLHRINPVRLTAINAISPREDLHCYEKPALKL